MPAALLALAPKCVLCLLAYAGLGAALAGPELCGAAGNPDRHGVEWLAACGAVGLIAFAASRRSMTR